MDTPSRVIGEIKRIGETLLWKGKPVIIDHKVACTPQNMGGFKKMDVGHKLDAHRAKWGMRYLDPKCRDHW